MAFAEDIVKGETTADECTVILKMLFHDQLEKYKDKSIFDKLTPISKPETGDGGEDR